MDSLRKPRSALSLPPTSQPFHLKLVSIIRSTFKNLGFYLSTHQIQALLFSAFIICCLLIPPLSLYFSPETNSAIVRRGRGEMMWENEGMMRQGILSSEDEVCWDRLAKYYDSRDIGHRARVVRMEQVLVSPSGRSGSGALSKRTLHHTLQLQKELERRLLVGEIEGLTCVRNGVGKCAISSPSNWWSSEAELLTDEDVHRTLSLSAGNKELPLTIINTLVGVGRDRKGAVKGADYLTMTFYLEDSSSDAVLRGIGSEREEAARDRAKASWRAAVRDVMAGKGSESHLVEQLGRMREGMGQGRRIILKHLPHLILHDNPRLFEDFLFVVGYIVAGVYVLFMVKGLHQVHSKAGLLFTGLVELVLSGIMSLSICWLMDLKVGLVPWKLIPFLVLVCGVDNMFVLINAIGGTDITLPVPERVAAGLSSVALSTTATLAVELVLASLLLKFLVVEVIRELVTFTAVALVVDYILEMTFFSTVLSIDIQRLELADLLRQGSKVGKASPSEDGDFNALSPPTSTSLSSLFSTAQTIYKQRAARTTTFSFLIFINLLLWTMYGSDHYLPAFCSEAALSKDRPLLGPSLAADFAHSLKRGRSGASLRSQENIILPGAGVAFWNLINPANASSVHVYIEPVSVVKFYDDEAAAPESSGEIVSTSWYYRMGIVVLPISSAMLALYFILAYLLKDADLLERQRSYSNQEAKDRKRPKGAAGVEMTTLRGKHAADVEVIASSRDLVASWSGLDESVIVWSKQIGKLYEPIPLAMPITADPASLILLAIDDESKFCAAATTLGRILVWSLDRKILIDFGSTSRIIFGPVLHLFTSPSRSIGSSPAPPGSASARHQRRYGFYTIHSDGHLVLWDCAACTSSVVVSPVGFNISNNMKSFVIDPTRQSSATAPLWPIYARAHSNGQLQLYQAASDASWSRWTEIMNVVVTTSNDPITSLAVGDFKLGGELLESTKSILVVGCSSGLVTLYDMESSRKISTITELGGSVKQIRLIAATKSKCSTCSEPILDGFNLVASTRSTISVLRVYTLPAMSNCRCNSNVVISSSTGLVRSGSIGLKTPASISKRSRRPSQLPIGAGTSLGVDDDPSYSPQPSPTQSAHFRRASPNSEELRKSTSGSHSRSSSLAVSSPGLWKGTDQFSISRPVTPDSATGEIPLFDPSQIVMVNPDGTEELSNSTSSTSTTLLPSIHVQSILSTSTDERGGWEVVDKMIVGVRRKQETREEKLLRMSEGGVLGEGRGPNSWEVWTVKTGTSPLLSPTTSTVSSSSSTALVEGSTLLDTLLSASTSSFSPRLAPKPLLDPLPDTLRRRSNLPSTTPAVSSPLRPRTPTLAVRFEDYDLPFCRARPILVGLDRLDDSSLIVGLGNTIGLIQEKKALLMIAKSNGRM